jgi:hypothetical protein
MKNTLTNTLAIFAISFSLISCEKDFYMPSATPIAEDNSISNEQPTIDPVDGEDVAELKSLWVKPNGEFENVQGVRVEIKNASGEVVFNDIDVVSAEDAMFQWDLSLDFQPEIYTFTVKTANGNLISTSEIDFAEAFTQDEYISNAPGVTFYLQMIWKKSE